MGRLEEVHLAGLERAVERYKSARSLLDVAHAAYEACAEEVAERVPESLLQGIAEIAEECGIKVKKVGSSVHYWPDSCEVTPEIVAAAEHVGFQDERRSKFYRLVEERYPWLRDDIYVWLAGKKEAEFYLREAKKVVEVG